MFTSLSAFLQTWEQQSGLTQRILNVLTDSSLGQRVTDQDRTLGRIAWHIITTIPEMVLKTGLVFETVDEDAPVPTSAKDIANQYRQASNAMAYAIENQWTDDTLSQERDMYGERWTIGTALAVLIYHEIHHRGQMTILMRQAGLQVPGIYGPSREEWGQYGIEPPRI